jgi:hypothetical protein
MVAPVEEPRYKIANMTAMNFFIPLTETKIKIFYCRGVFIFILRGCGCFGFAEKQDIFCPCWCYSRQGNSKDTKNPSALAKGVKI